MKNNGVWKYIATILGTMLVSFLVMWLTVGVRAVSESELENEVVKLKSQIVMTEVRYNEKLSSVTALLERTTETVNRLAGYLEAKEGYRGKDKK